MQSTHRRLKGAKQFLGFGHHVSRQRQVLSIAKGTVYQS